MSELHHAMKEIHYVDREIQDRNRVNELHPVSKLFVTISYLIAVVSFSKYQLLDLLAMGIYPLVMSIWYDISFKRCATRLRVVFFFVFIMGIVNPFFDRVPIIKVGSLLITGGMISMLTLWMKTILAVFAGYILMEMTSMEEICYGLQRLHVPALFITVLSLIYRYLILMLKEVDKVTTAYKMRATNQKGIHYRAWGSLVGYLMLRTIDRGQIVYESMTLRGFQGAFPATEAIYKKGASTLFVILWMGAFIGLRLFPVFEIVGNLLMR